MHEYMCVCVLSIMLMCVTSLTSAGPDYVKQQFKEPVEIKEVPVEKKDKSPRDSPHFYRKGTTPPHSPVTSIGATPPPSPHSSKKKGHLANSTGRKTSKEEKPSRKTSKEEKSSHKSSKDERSNRKLSKEERVTVTDGPKSSHVHIEAPPKPAKVQQPTPASAPPPQPPAIPVNGELHTEYHSYYVKTPTRIPPPPDPEEDPEEEPSALALARMPPQPPKSYSTPTPKPASIRDGKSDQKLRKQDSLKPKSLTDAKKSSMEIADNAEETVSIKGGKVFEKIWGGGIGPLVFFLIRGWISLSSLSSKYLPTSTSVIQQWTHYILCFY